MSEQPEVTSVDCPRAKSAWTPCVARDGRSAVLDDGTCVGCLQHPADLLADLVPKYIALKEGKPEVGSP